MIMQDRNVALIVGLADLLRDKTQEAEELRKALSDTEDQTWRLNDAKEEMARLRDGWSSDRRALAEALAERDALRRNNAGDHNSKAFLLDYFMANPAKLSQVTAELTEMCATANATPPPDRIHMIKRAWEITGLGLKQSKDLVEAFLPPGK
jgi:septal ring factor EnvC (AmiA/AmiB activator)